MRKRRKWLIIFFTRYIILLFFLFFIERAFIERAAQYGAVYVMSRYNVTFFQFASAEKMMVPLHSPPGLLVAFV
jgi:hypothetical protein